MDETAEVAEVIRAAFATLQGRHPDVVARISAAIGALGGGDSNVHDIESAFRTAAIGLVPGDKDAAQVLFKVAETLAEIATYWSLPKDSP
jgi:hypothetical protein